MQFGEVACKQTVYGYPINGFSLQATEETFKQGTAMRWTAQNILLNLLYFKHWSHLDPLFGGWRKTRLRKNLNDLLPWLVLLFTEPKSRLQKFIPSDLFPHFDSSKLELPLVDNATIKENRSHSLHLGNLLLNLAHKILCNNCEEF